MSRRSGSSAAAGQASMECNNEVKGQTLRRNATKQRPALCVEITLIWTDASYQNSTVKIYPPVPQHTDIIY